MRRLFRDLHWVRFSSDFLRGLSYGFFRRRWFRRCRRLVSGYFNIFSFLLIFLWVILNFLRVLNRSKRAIYVLLVDVFVICWRSWLRCRFHWCRILVIETFVMFVFIFILGLIWFLGVWWLFMRRNTFSIWIDIIDAFLFHLKCLIKKQLVFDIDPYYT